MNQTKVSEAKNRATEKKNLTFFRQVKKNNVRRVADSGIVVGEFQFARVLDYLEDGDVICPLVAAIQESPCRIETETAWIISACPFFSNVGQFAL